MAKPDDTPLGKVEARIQARKWKGIVFPSITFHLDARLKKKADKKLGENADGIFGWSIREKLATWKPEGEFDETTVTIPVIPLDFFLTAIGNTFYASPIALTVDDDQSSADEMVGEGDPNTGANDD